MEKKVVKIEADLKPLIPKFLENRSKDIEQIHAAISIKDYESIRFISHRMKGVCGSYGFHQLGQIVRELEEAARRESENEIQSVYEKLDNFMKQLEVSYD